MQGKASENSSLVGLASDNDNASGFLVHALEQKEGEKPVPEVVGCKNDVVPVAGPCLFAEVLIASIEDKGTDPGNLAR